jgi:C-terminal processing protease CtpA/Prc
VTPGSPAFRAGVDPGDRIVGWSGDGGLDALSYALQGPPGEAVELIVARGDRRAPVKLVLAELI